MGKGFGACIPGLYLLAYVVGMGTFTIFSTLVCQDPVEVVGCSFYLFVSLSVLSYLRLGLQTVIASSHLIRVHRSATVLCFLKNQQAADG